MKIKSLETSSSASDFPQKFSDELYFSEDVTLDEFSYRSPYSVKHVISGEERYEVEGREMTISAGQHLLVSNESTVRLLPSNGKAVSIFIDPRTMAEVAATPDLILPEGVSTGSKNEVQTLLDRIVGHLMSTDKTDSLTIGKTVFYDLAEALVTDQREHSSRLSRLSNSKMSTTQEQYRRLKAGVAYLRDSVNSPYSLALASAAATISAYHFQRLFRRCYGITPYAYHLNLQMSRAKKLLSDGTTTVEDIAFQLGYSSSTSFGRAFKRHVGFSPTQLMK